MPTNKDPMFSGTPDIQWATVVTTANTAKDGSGTVATIFTADATNGGYVSEVNLKPAGTNIATVGRIFINNGASNATPANNALLREISLPATTITETAAQNDYIIPINRALPAGYKLNFVLGTTVAAGWIPTAIGGKY